MLPAKYSFQNLIAPPQLFCLSRREKSHWKKHTGTHSGMLPQQSRKQTIKMITLVSNTHSELLFFKRPNVSLFHHSGSSYSRWWKHVYLSKLSHFAALLADFKSCLPCASSQRCCLCQQVAMVPTHLFLSHLAGHHGAGRGARLHTHTQPAPSLQPLHWHNFHKRDQNLLEKLRLQHSDKGMKQILSSAF